MAAPRLPTDRRLPVFLRVGVTSALALVVSSCGPSYPHQRLAADLQQMCLKDYHLSTRVQLVDHDVAVVCAIEGLLKQGDGSVEFAPTKEANAKLGDLVEAIHRVALSTDWPVNFYTIIATDPDVHGAWLMLVRYLDDVRRVYANAISTTEFFQRTVLNLQYDPGHPPDFDRLLLKDMTLEDFLGLQMAKRLQSAFRSDPHFRAAYDVGSCVGEYRQGAFQFVVDIAPRAEADVSEQEVGQIFDRALHLIAGVLHDYHFDRFNEVQLLHFPSGKTLDIPKTRLDAFLPTAGQLK